MRTPRRGSAFDQAEAAFKAATSKPVETPAKKVTPPEGKEMVTLRLDRAVLEHFQEDGPGWQERVNAALRAAAGLDPA
ncbi:BrnA antitoxin family protein [Devosia ginsengisoli]|uniref:BrnA antitoxin family protein n=1 Tax=Devosia ginsengisoli TaxID=400770 RepID=UPI0026EE7DD8|nr:BrnA antitoxin family protein [Devosia ginsengisoli]MCR6669891.1 BrnA antitoxin family protein [Devosia ginsengisoli]